jgi:AraC-like DNA-binding protein
VHSVPDECTIIEFKKDFYLHIKEHYKGSFFTNGDLHSLKIIADPETEFLHYQLIQLLSNKTYSKLQLDSVVMEIVERTLGCIHHSNIDKMLGMRLKKNHLITIERAKAFMIEELENDISLIDVADKCNVSPFHFCRIFKQFTSYSPYQFLLMARLMHARMLLKTTPLPIADIAYASGFNSIAHFTAAFTAKNEMAPGKFRERSKTYGKTARILNT